MKPLRYVIGLGANLGARHGALHLAQRLMGAEPDMTVRARSQVYESPPLGPPQPDYLNAAVLVSSALPPARLLSRLQAIEAQLGRQRGVVWGARTIDLDILWSDREACTSRLVIPHRGLQERWWALAPLLDVAPFLRDRYGPLLDGFAERTRARSTLSIPTGVIWEQAPMGDAPGWLCPLPTAPAERLDRVVMAAIALDHLEGIRPPSKDSRHGGPAVGLQLERERWSGWLSWARALLGASLRGRRVLGCQVAADAPPAPPPVAAGGGTVAGAGEPGLSGLYAWSSAPPWPPGVRVRVRPDRLELSSAAPR